MKNLSASRLFLLAPLFALCSAALPAAGLRPRPPQMPFLPMTSMNDDIGRRANLPLRHVFTSQREYHAFFGHDAPGVDFGREWVVYYSAGLVSGGLQLSILSVEVTERGHALKITTQSIQPGPGCVTVTVIGAPYTLVKIPALKDLRMVRFTSANQTIDCP